MNTEESIRQAFHGRAELAADPLTAVTGVRAKIRRRRRQRRGVAVLAAVAVVAVAVPGLGLAQQGKTNAAARPWPAGPLLPAVRITTKPGWLPKGMSEDSRVFAVGRIGESRSYSRDSGTEADNPIVGISIERSGEPIGSDGTRLLGLSGSLPMVNFEVLPKEAVITPTEIQGLPARVYAQEVTCQVTWKVADGSTMLISVHKADDVPADLCGVAKRVAGSLLPDSETTVMSGMAANWLPAGWRTVLAAVGLAPNEPHGTGCNSWLLVEKPGIAQNQVTISLDRGEAGRLSPPMEIRGRNAYVVETKDYMGDLRVDLGGGRRLTINQDLVTERSERLTHDEVVKIAENVAVGPEPTCPGG